MSDRLALETPMNLPEQFHRPDPEPRRHERHLLSPCFSADLTVRPHFGSQFAFVNDVSTGGLGLTYHTPLEPGDVLAIQVHNAGEASARTLLATVRHSTVHGSSWLLGCEFRSQLTEVELLCLSG